MPSMLEALERKYFAPLEELLPDVDNDVNICFVSVGSDTHPTTHDIINNTTTTSSNNNNNNNNNQNNNNNNNNSNSNNNNNNINNNNTSFNSGGCDEHLISIFIPRLPPLKIVPELLVLNDCDIDCAGDCDRIKDKCRRVRELDLAQNKLRDWTEVFEIIKHMPRIEFLNLSKNQLMSPISRKEVFTPNINNLRGIVLNGTYLDWEGIEVLLQNLPRLEELHLSLNNYKEVLIDAHSESCSCCTINANAESSPSSSYSSSEDSTNEQQNCRRYRKTRAHSALKILHFTGNPIERWEEICRLGRVFPHLENLVLADCPIKTIDTAAQDNELIDNEATQMPGTNEAFKYFPNLLLLNLSCANINTWDDIDRLAQFPKLNNLRVKNWPLWDRLECTEHERRQLLIARLPNVSLLNGGGTISADEREDAERAFIRYYMEKPEFERPKRYDELIAMHGKLDPLVNVNLKPDKRIKVQITYAEKTEERMVDVYRTVSDLKQKLEKIYNLPANKMRLFYLDQDYKEFGPEIMKYPNKFLYSYNIQSGDEIIIDEKK